MGQKPGWEGTLHPVPTRAAWPLGLFVPRPRLYPECWDPRRAQHSLPGRTHSLLCPEVYKKRQASQLTPEHSTLTCEHSGRLGTVGLGHKVTDVSGSVTRRRQALDMERPHLKQSAHRPVSLHVGAGLQAHRFSQTPPAPGHELPSRVMGLPQPQLHPAKVGLAGDHGTQAWRCRDPREPVLAGVPNQRADPLVSSKPGQVYTRRLTGKKVFS